MIRKPSASRPGLFVHERSFVPGGRVSPARLPLVVVRKIGGELLKLLAGGGAAAPLRMKLCPRGDRRLNHQSAGLVRHHLVAPPLDFDQLTHM